MHRSPTFESLESRQLLAGDPITTQVAAAELASSGALQGSIHGQVVAFASAGLDSANEPQPIADVVIQLVDESGHTMQTVTTLADGRYSFHGLSPGLFGLRQVQPSEYTDGRARAGTAGGSVLHHNLIADIVVGPNTVATGYEFWEFPLQAHAENRHVLPTVRPSATTGLIGGMAPTASPGQTNRAATQTSNALERSNSVNEPADAADLRLLLANRDPAVQPESGEDVSLADDIRQVEPLDVESLEAQLTEELAGELSQLEQTKQGSLQDDQHLVSPEAHTSKDDQAADRHVKARQPARGHGFTKDHRNASTGSGQGELERKMRKPEGETAADPQPAAQPPRIAQGAEVNLT